MDPETVKSFEEGTTAAIARLATKMNLRLTCSLSTLTDRRILTDLWLEMSAWTIANRSMIHDPTTS